MKIVRVITILLVAILMVSVWTPSTVSAKGLGKYLTVAPKSVGMTVNPVTTRVVRFTVNNRSGGTLFITLDGPKSYYFVVPGTKARFDIEPGRYTVTAISTACSSTHIQSKNMKNGGNVVYYCDSQ